MILTLILISLFSKAQDPFFLAPGQSLSLKVPSHGTIYNSNSKVIKLRDLGRTLVVVGKTKGEAQIRTGLQTYLIRVISNADYQLFYRLQELIKPMRGLKVEMPHSQIVVSGRLLRLSDWLRLKEVVDSKSSFLMKARIDSQIQQDVEMYFRSLFINHALPAPSILWEDGVQVHVSSARAKLFESLLKPYGFQILPQAGLIEIEPLVQVHITVAEVRHKFLRRYGIRWPNQYESQLIPNPFSQTTPQTISLEALEEQGVAQILASPQLLCRSGKEAQFLAGGEIPIKIMNQHMQDVVWKRYGILLNIKPMADQKGQMSIELTTEVSSIDTSQTVDGIPGFLTNRIQSHFDLVKSQSLILSGLIKQDSGNNREGLPLLSSIPILGSLFSSREFREQKTELVIVVTPRVLTNDL